MVLEGRGTVAKRVRRGEVMNGGEREGANDRRLPTCATIAYVYSMSVYAVGARP
jgi:hypothetical protein